MLLDVSIIPRAFAGTVLRDDNRIINCAEKDLGNFRTKCVEGGKDLLQISVNEDGEERREFK